MGAEGVLPVNARTHRISGLTVSEVLSELHDADQRQPPGRISRLTLGGVQISKLVIDEEYPQHIAHLHVDIALVEGSTGDGKGQVGDGWNGTCCRDIDWLSFYNEMEANFHLYKMGLLLWLQLLFLSCRR